jgi:CspA family cold shock protein
VVETIRNHRARRAQTISKGRFFARRLTWVSKVDVEREGVATGTVKWCSDQKGYGFIRQEEGPDVFVHHSEILGTGFKTLHEGDRMTFEVVQDQKGPAAKNVSKA